MDVDLGSTKTFIHFPLGEGVEINSVSMDRLLKLRSSIENSVPMDSPMGTVTK